MPVLIITNGDVTAETLRAAKPDATVLPWRDVLHEGPVRNIPADQFRAERAAFLADGVVHTEVNVLADLEARDATLTRHTDFDRIELWFEHDLYDQLQIVQVISRLATLGRRENLFHVPSPRHLGPLAVNQMLKLEALRLPVNEPMFETAARAWNAYRADNPGALVKAQTGPIAGFPFLGQAITRALQELPGPDGLTRTERQTLYSIDRGVVRPGMLFARVLNMEEAAFMGDRSFFAILSGLAFAAIPLLTGLPERFEPALMAVDERRKAFITATVALTQFGADVLGGKADRAAHTTVDFWLGGTHVTPDNLWRWDDDNETLVPPEG